MDAKKKIALSIISFVVIIIITVVAVVSVLAARTVTVSADINIVYTSDEVAGIVTAQYCVGDEEFKNFGVGSIEFDGYETGLPEEKLTESDLKIELTKGETIKFKFTFTNSGSTEYTASLINEPTLVGFTATKNGGNGNAITIPGNTVTPQEYIITYEINNLKESASLKGNFEWELKSKNA